MYCLLSQNNINRIVILAWTGGRCWWRAERVENPSRPGICFPISSGSPNTNANWHNIFSWIKPRSWCSNSPLSWLTLGSLFFSLNQTKICPSLLSYRDQMTEQRKHKQRMGKRVFCQGYSWSWLCFNFRSPQQCPKSSEHWRETLKWWDLSGTGIFFCRTICWSWSSALLELELYFVGAGALLCWSWSSSLLELVSPLLNFGFLCCARWPSLPLWLSVIQLW